jgi:DNA primase
MSEKYAQAATSEHLPSPSPVSGRDWAHWLQHARHAAIPGTPVMGGGQVHDAWTSLVHLARRAGFTVERGNCAAADGFTTWTSRHIRIRPDAPPGHAVAALAHQLGHVLLHGDIARLDPSGTVPCQGTRKVEADSVACLVTAHLGIGAPAATFPNVSSWAGTDPRARPAATIQAVTSRILAATTTITAHLDAALAPAGKPAIEGRTAGAGQSLLADDQPARREELVRIHHSATRFFCDRLPGSWVPGYLTSRRLGPAVQQRWQAGYAPAAWDALTSHLQGLGYPDELIEAAGLARRSRRGTLIDTFRDRAMLPIRSADGTIVAFIGRTPPGDAGDGMPKYLNSPGTLLYSKSEILFGLWENRDALASGAQPVIVEGPFDAIAVTTASPGQHAGLALCGATLAPQQAATLSGAVNRRTTGVLVAFDPDRAGHRAAVSAYPLLSPLTDHAMAAVLPAGTDPAQILRDHGPTTLTDMLTSRTRPLADLVIDAEVDQWSQWLQYATGQINALHAAAPLIAALPSAQVARQVARLADRLGLDHAIITEAVTDALPQIITSGPVASARAATAPHSGRGDQPVLAGDTAAHDFPGSVQEGIEHVVTGTPAYDQPGRAGTTQDRLPTSSCPASSAPTSAPERRPAASI